ncbi:MAG: IclR family transcriptional regulator [Firmicutes bacterium]|nr:IclR family transcriptional regulator [Bacillota bacterium]
MANSNGVIVQSVARALDILELFSQSPQLGISEISDGMKLSKSTVYGIVNTLVAYGCLEQDSATKKYKLGMKLFEMGRTVESRMDLRAEARPFCEALSKKYGQTVHLATHCEGDVIYIDKFDTPDFLITYSQVGKRAPMTCTGVGKAMLAYLPNEYINKYILNHEFAVKTPNSIKNSRELEENLMNVVTNGFAEDNEEIETGLKCVAAPIFNHKNEPVAAVSISGMASKMTPEAISVLAEEIKKCAQSISIKIGCKP